MKYIADLEFVQEVFKKAHLGCTVTASDTLDVIYDGMAGVVCPRRDAAHTWRILPKTLYKLTDPFGRGWCILRPDGEGESTKVIIGPFLHTRMTEGRLSEIAERVGIQPSPKSFRYMMEYYTGLPIINESSPILLMIETLCERIWGSRAFVVRDLDGEGAVGEPFAKTMLDVEPTDTLVSKRGNRAALHL